jgi:hypothetical protein
LMAIGGQFIGGGDANDACAQNGDLHARLAGRASRADRGAVRGCIKRKIKGKGANANKKRVSNYQ